MSPYLKKNLLVLSLSLIFVGALAALADVPISPSEVCYGTGVWDAAKFGNHRAVIRVEGQADAVRVRIPWRRRDTKPEKKNVVVVEAATGAQVKNVCPLALNREYGDFVFQPVTAPGEYYYYYLTNTSKGNQHYPTVTYNPLEITAEDPWLKKWGLSPLAELSPRGRQAPSGAAASGAEPAKESAALPAPPGPSSADFPEARVVEIQSIDAFNSFHPMEVIATAMETARLLAEHPAAPYLLFPEDRRFSVRMKDGLPMRWVEAGPRNEFAGEALRGEFFTFQIGVFACRSAIESTDVTFEDLKLTQPAPSPARGKKPQDSSVHPHPSSPPSGGRGSSSVSADDKLTSNQASASPVASGQGQAKPTLPLIPASGMHSFNTRGVNWNGKPFVKTCAVPLGQVQPLWCGVQVPREVPPGAYEGEITVLPRGLPPTSLRLRLDVKDPVLEDAGDSDPSRMSRLRWLDSRIAFDDDIVPPFTPLRVEDRTVSCLGRSVTVDDTGLPGRLTSFFTPELTGVGTTGRELLSAPFALIVSDAEGNELASTLGKFEFTKKTPGAVSWRAESQSGPLTLTVQGTMEFDGFVEFKVSVSRTAAPVPSPPLEISDIRLEIPLLRDAARYMMGMGYKGGLRPAEFSWTWDRTLNQDALWLGDVNAGLQVSLRDENYSRPLNTNFYLSKPLNLPPSWWNDGEGICAVQETSASTVLFTASSGPRRIRPSDTLHFNFNLLLTPFKPIDPRTHFATRFFHAYKPVDEVAHAGANTINVHHATDINPYINYPFLRPAEMKAYIDEAHARGMKVKIYYTIRELSNRAPELFALRSLGDEIFSRGPGGGFSWLQEHLVSDYIAAWFVPELKDAAIINSGMSRWHNYYLEGLDWLVRNIGIDGLYIDDVAFDRTTMKRVRKILDCGRPGALIDLHSANQFNPRDGFASSANLYLEHFPYLNRLWFGEYFDYNAAPDYWLVEISGIPFGLMGEMLQDGGNPWRGMVYGMTNRLPWSGQDPSRLWKVWDEFGIGEAEMAGWWSPNCPVRTGNPYVLATVYVKKRGGKAGAAGGATGGGGGAMIALASWAKERTEVRLDIDWKALGIDVSAAQIMAPAIADFQTEAQFHPGDPISVDPGKGWILILK
ncbi:MAG: hypothetical protein A2W03_09440 [Candidatus Aminicenantes bacterium RBG_16_63_16]|nr:MAG: hypothetical protein A2W03_09440 [Candidatus Aminicenantes bacterium RBG_16_63_16]